jgi:hypothetical protein
MPQTGATSSSPPQRCALCGKAAPSNLSLGVLTPAPDGPCPVQLAPLTLRVYVCVCVCVCAGLGRARRD